MAAPLIKKLRRLVQYSRTTRHFIQRYYSVESIREILQEGNINKDINVKGWVKSLRWHKGLTFMHVCDGSGPQHLQVVVPESVSNCAEVTFGSCIRVKGKLVASPGKSQNVELAPSLVEVIGSCDSNEFPIKQHGKHPPPYTRDILHLRPKTNLFSSLLRIRNAASMAVHQFFQKNNYIFIHTPVLTSNNCEGSCEAFQIQALNSDLPAQRSSERVDCDDPDPQSGSDVNSQLEKNFRHFFRKPTYLTVSGQLHLEVITGALTRAYNFGPTFRAENAIGSYHLSEFYMAEAELAFTSHIGDILEVMEALVKHVHASVMDNCSEDVNLYTKFAGPPNHQEKVKKMMALDFKRISYTEAVDILKRAKEDLQFKVSWGCDLKKEHELYLTKTFGNCPVFVTDFPEYAKPFYARRNADLKTVAAADLLVPGVGELCGGSLREERPDVLESVMTHQGLMEEMSWYLDLRKFGTCPHGGFGLGFERLLMALLGAQSVKDMIPFPRWPGRCNT